MLEGAAAEAAEAAQQQLQAGAEAGGVVMEEEEAAGQQAGPAEPPELEAFADELLPVPDAEQLVVPQEGQAAPGAMPAAAGPSGGGSAQPAAPSDVYTADTVEAAAAGAAGLAGDDEAHQAPAADVAGLAKGDHVAPALEAGDMDITGDMPTPLRSAFGRALAAAGDEAIAVEEEHAAGRWWGGGAVMQRLRVSMYEQKDVQQGPAKVLGSHHPQPASAVSSDNQQCIACSLWLPACILPSCLPQPGCCTHLPEADTADSITTATPAPPQASAATGQRQALWLTAARCCCIASRQRPGSRRRRWRGRARAGAGASAGLLVPLLVVMWAFMAWCLVVAVWLLREPLATCFSWPAGVW